jgi:hypothetical protein
MVDLEPEIIGRSWWKWLRAAQSYSRLIEVKETCQAEGEIEIPLSSPKVPQQAIAACKLLEVHGNSAQLVLFV